jgi:hypothetical protein
VIDCLKWSWCHPSSGCYLEDFSTSSLDHIWNKKIGELSETHHVYLDHACVFFPFLHPEFSISTKSSIIYKIVWCDIFFFCIRIYFFRTFRKREIESEYIDLDTMRSLELFFYFFEFSLSTSDEEESMSCFCIEMSEFESDTTRSAGDEGESHRIGE